MGHVQVGGDHQLDLAIPAEQMRRVPGDIAPLIVRAQPVVLVSADRFSWRHGGVAGPGPGCLLSGQHQWPQDLTDELFLLEPGEAFTRRVEAYNSSIAVEHDDQRRSDVKGHRCDVMAGDQGVAQRSRLAAATVTVKIFHAHTLACRSGVSDIDCSVLWTNMAPCSTSCSNRLETRKTPATDHNPWLSQMVTRRHGTSRERPHPVTASQPDPPPVAFAERALPRRPSSGFPAFLAGR